MCFDNQASGPQTQQEPNLPNVYLGDFFSGSRGGAAPQPTAPPADPNAGRYVYIADPGASGVLPAGVAKPNQYGDQTKPALSTGAAKPIQGTVSAASALTPYLPDPYGLRRFDENGPSQYFEVGR